MTAAGPTRVLVVWCPDWPAAEVRAFERVVSTVEEFCPRVELLRPGACAIGARGPARYFGGETALARKIVAAVAGRGIACQAGLAEGLFAAQLAARAGAPGAVIVVAPGQTREFLAAHPVSVLGSEELTDLLPRLGIRTLGEFAALPASEAVNRFGTAGALAHRLAHGLDPRPLVTRPVPADLSVRMEFDPPAELAEPVVFAAKALAERFAAGLAARGVTCIRMEVQVTWADGRDSRRLWRHDGLLTDGLVADRVRGQLDGATAGTGEDGGIVLLRLVPDQLVRATGRQLALWGEAAVPDKVARAAMRVQALLGHDAVLRPVRSGGRSVADQTQLLPFGENMEPKLAADRPWPGRIPGPAPAVVYPEPRPARVTDEAGTPVTVSGRCALSGAPADLAVDGEQARAVMRWAGPWPLAERWWDPAQASRVARFQLVTDDGRAWLAVVRDGAWQVEAGYW